MEVLSTREVNTASMLAKIIRKDSKFCSAMEHTQTLSYLSIMGFFSPSTPTTRYRYIYLALRNSIRVLLIGAFKRLFHPRVSTSITRENLPSPCCPTCVSELLLPPCLKFADTWLLRVNRSRPSLIELCSSG